MCPDATLRGRRWLAGLLVSAFAGLSQAQVLAPDWRRIGNTAVEAGLASEAGGPVDRVWFSADGRRLLVRTGAGRIFQTGDFDTWTPVDGEVPPEPPAPSPVPRPPETGARAVSAERRSGLAYALGRAVYRSEDGGLSWTNLTDYLGESILGGGFTDLAVSPQNEDDIAVAGRYGVWRSLDGGLSWTGLNRSLPNLPVRRLVRLPNGPVGMRILLENLGVVEWAPGEKAGWRPVEDQTLTAEEALKRAAGALLGGEVSSVAVAGEAIYAGAAMGGTLWASLDRGRTWRSFTLPEAGPIRDLWASPENPRVAVAAGGGRVLKTTNGGIFWDDITADLADPMPQAVTADLESGAIYVGGAAGVHFTFADLRGAATAAAWSPLGGRLAGRRVFDVALDAAGHQLFAAIDGEGVFVTLAPHRFFYPKLVHAADLTARPASPGALLSLLGRQVRQARAGALDVPVLSASPGESQIQVPFEVSGAWLTLALATAGRTGEPETMNFGMALRQAAPAILVDRDGTPLVIDATSGVLLDAMTPAHAGARIQILATGLGKVRPEWPAGMPAPLENPPRVTTEVRVWLDGVPLEINRATLAPGYVGFYLVEARLPDVVNRGPAQLMLEAGGEPSNRVRIYLEP